MKNKHKAFSLAEVLITLGVIGVVAAMTLPAVIQHHQKQVTVNRLKKFHSIMNQAIRLSETENGSCSNWDIPGESNEDILEFYNTYLAKYIKSLDITTQEVLHTTSGSKKTLNLIKLSDGSAFAMISRKENNRLFGVYFYPQGSKYDSDKFSRYRFIFQIYKPNCTMEPYSYQWNGTRNALKTNGSYGCSNSTLKSYCAKLIEYDGWQIAKDYPW